MNIATIKTALWGWANANAGVAVVWADQAAPRPARPYATIKIAGVYKVAGQDEQRLTNTDGVLDIVGHRRLTCSLQFFGASVAQYAQNLQQSLEKPSVLASLAASNITVSTTGQLINLSQYRETNFEEVFNFDVEFLALATLSDTVGYITKTQIISDVSGHDETNIIEG